MDKQKLKTLILVLRSLPIELQESILHEMPLEIVQEMSTMDVADENLSNEDLEYFYRSWPELASILDSVNAESKKEQRAREAQKILDRERPKVRNYILHRTGKSNDHVEISAPIAKLIDQMALH